MNDADLKVLERCLHELGEYFDSVNIFVTKMEGEKTFHAIYGSGNFFARLGLVREWLIKQDENVRESHRSS